jgi:hypothetical protein
MRKPSNKDFVVIPSRAGKDLHNSKGTEDAYIRIESYDHFGTAIYVDRFDSDVEDADKAHIASESFPHSDAGAEEATHSLQTHGFRVAVMIK